jgi:hypothetical protein
MKIIYACEQAISDDYEYVWIDTCCIDKTSSAELSEAINSMFQWYQNAGVCYAYVEDVQLENFGTSRWFTRGWTLQELLAPAEVIFFGSEWIRLGTKFDLANQITAVTGIVEEALLYQDQLKKKSVAQRMSWASQRETTRLEDAAYCLLGIFGVNMPLLYGEGKNAFFRLQEEVLKSTVDQSLFSWSMASATYTHRGSCGIFAESPGDYQYSSSVVPFQRSTDTAPYVMTNKGLQIEMPLIEKSGYVLGLLDCQFNDEISTCIAIVLLRTHTPDVFFRTKGATVGEHAVEGGVREGGGLVVITHREALQAVSSRIYIPRDEYEVPLQRSSYQVKFSDLQKQGFRLVLTRPKHANHSNVRWNEEAQSMHILNVLRSSWQSVAFVFHHQERKVAFAVYFDDDPSINTEGARSDEGSLIEKELIDLWLSPIVDEPDPDKLPRPSYTIEDWWHSLSYGMDPHGAALERHNTLRFSVPDANGIDGPYEIYANLEAGNHFGQKVRIFHLNFYPILEQSRPGSRGFIGSQAWHNEFTDAGSTASLQSADNQLSPYYMANFFSTLPEVVPSSMDRDYYNGVSAQTPTWSRVTKHSFVHHWRSLNFKRSK